MVEFGLAQKFLNDAELLFERKSFTSAAILASKSVFASSDFLLFSKLNIFVSDHKKRFNAFKFNFPEISDALNDAFELYRAAYRKVLTKDEAERVIKIGKEFTSIIKKKMLEWDRQHPPIKL